MIYLENKKWLKKASMPFYQVSFPLLPSVPQPPPETLDDHPNGPGTILSKMLEKLGIKSSANCSCKRKAMEMNKKGVEWCSNNVPTIVEWLREEATKRKLPFIDFAGKMLIQRAIKVAKKNS